MPLICASASRRICSENPTGKLSAQACIAASTCGFISRHAATADRIEIAGVSIVQIAEPWRGVGAVTKNAVVVAPGRLDRSATGTGLSARLAALHARGAMKVGESMTHASVIGSTFDGRIVAETTVGGRPAIVPAIRGSAWITGITQVLVDPTDPFPEGYLLSDTWPGPDLQ